MLTQDLRPGERIIGMLSKNEELVELYLSCLLLQYRQLFYRGGNIALTPQWSARSHHDAGNKYISKLFGFW